MRFAGEQLDTDTGLYHLRAREYDPATGRFTATDPIGAAAGSTYAYADGRPTVLVDPSGMSADGPFPIPRIPDVTAPFKAAVGIVKDAAGGYLNASSGNALAPALGINTNCPSPAWKAGDLLSWLPIGPGDIHYAVIITGKSGRIAARLGRDRREVAKAIEKIKQQGLGKGGLGRRTDVGVDDETGDVYPIRPDGPPGQDPIDNIFEHLP